MGLLLEWPFFKLVEPSASPLVDRIDMKLAVTNNNERVTFDYALANDLIDGLIKMTGGIIANSDTYGLLSVFFDPIIKRLCCQISTYAAQQTGGFVFRPIDAAGQAVSEYLGALVSLPSTNTYAATITGSSGNTVLDFATLTPRHTSASQMGMNQSFMNLFFPSLSVALSNFLYEQGIMPAGELTPDYSIVPY